MLVSENIEQLRAEGFTILNHVVLEEKLIALRALTDRIVEYADKNKVDPFSNYYLRHRSDQGVLYDLYQRHPEFQSLAKLDPVLDVLEGVLGADIFFYENSLVYKPKGRANAVPWHQDFISRPTEPKKFIVWIAFDNVTIKNGALKAIPKSHLNGYLPYFRVKGETHHDRIDMSRLDLNDAVFLELNAGDVLIFDCMLCHGSDEVHVDEPRRAFRASYQGFDQIFTPRGAPIVMRGGSPESVASRYDSSYIPETKSIFRRAANRIGRLLADM